MPLGGPSAVPCRLNSLLSIVRCVTDATLRPEKLIVTAYTALTPSTVPASRVNATDAVDVDTADAELGDSSPSSDVGDATAPGAADATTAASLTAACMPWSTSWAISTVLPQPDGPLMNTDRPAAMRRRDSSEKRAVSTVGTTIWCTSRPGW